MLFDQQLGGEACIFVQFLVLIPNSSSKSWCTQWAIDPISQSDEPGVADVRDARRVLCEVADRTASVQLETLTVLTVEVVERVFSLLFVHLDFADNVAGRHVVWSLKNRVGKTRWRHVGDMSYDISPARHNNVSF